MRRVRMLDLRSEYSLFKDEVRAAVDGVLESQQFIGGPAVEELERAIAQRVGVGHAVAVSSGTDALICAMMALRLGPGDEVILPAFTFFATAGSVARVGAKPVFVDVDPRTFNIDPGRIEAAITDRTRAVIAVHLYGQCADLDRIQALADQYGLSVIEDAAQAIGATYHDRAAGSIGRLACFSFYPTKNLGGFGEGGMVVTDDEKLARTVRQLRQHGESQRYVHQRVGGNFRLDTMKAAILLVKLRYLDEFTARRRRNALCYDRLLKETRVTPPHMAAGQSPVYHQYSILCDRRDDLATFLRNRGVETSIYYPVPLHLQECFASLGYKTGALPVTEDICGRIISLPCHPMLTEEDLGYVSSCIREFYQTGNEPQSVAGSLAGQIGAR